MANTQQDPTNPFAVAAEEEKTTDFKSLPELN
jgi:hypothetical protein